LSVNPSYHHDLYQQVAAGNESAFRELFELYVPRLQAMITRITHSATVADDLVQEVFLKIWVARDQLSSLQQPAAWIMKIGFHLAVNYTRRQALWQRAVQEERYKQESILNNTSGNEQVDFQQLLQLVNTAVSSLPAKQRAIYRMSREKGMTITEIATELDLAVSTVKNLLVMALKAIRAVLQNAGHLGWLIVFMHLL